MYECLILLHNYVYPTTISSLKYFRDTISACTHLPVMFPTADILFEWQISSITMELYLSPTCPRNIWPYIPDFILITLNMFHISNLNTFRWRQDFQLGLSFRRMLDSFPISQRAFDKYMDLKCVLNFPFIEKQIVQLAQTFPLNCCLNE